jgi:hypothetical protein
MNNKILLKHIIISLTIFFICLSFYLKLITQNTSYHADEYEWVGRTYFFYLFLKRDFDNSLFRSFYSYDQPKLVYYIYGLGLYPFYIKDKKNSKIHEFTYIDWLHQYNLFQDLTNRTPDWFVVNNQFVKFNQSINNKFLKTDDNLLYLKSLKLINIARLISILFFSISSVIVYFISLIIIKKVSYSILVCLFYFTNGIVSEWVSKAMAEGILLFFFNLCFLFLLLWFKRRLFILIFFLAVFISLLTQVKINGIVLFIFYNFILFLDFFKKNINIKILFLSFFTFNFIFFILFLLLNPFVYMNFPKNFLFLFLHRYNTMISHQIKFPQTALLNFHERIFFFFNSLIFPGFYMKTLFEKNGYSYLINYFKLAIFILGFIELLRRSFKDNFYFNLFIMFIFLFLIIIIFLYLNWSRYFDILVLPILLIQALGFSSLMVFINNLNNSPFTHFFRKKE